MTTRTEFLSSLEKAIKSLQMKLESSKESLERTSIDFYFSRIYEIKYYELIIAQLQYIVEQSTPEVHEAYVGALDRCLMRELKQNHNPSSSRFSEATFALKREVAICVYETVCIALERESIMQ